jgi:hypothetical protein
MINAGIWLCIIPDVATGLDILCWFMPSSPDNLIHRLLFTLTLIYSIWETTRRRPEQPQEPRIIYIQHPAPQNVNQPNAIAIGTINMPYELGDVVADGREKSQIYYDEGERGRTPTSEHYSQSSSFNSPVTRGPTCGDRLRYNGTAPIMNDRHFSPVSEAGTTPAQSYSPPSPTYYEKNSSV